MSLIPQIDAIFSHVVSQWTYRWLPLPDFDLRKAPRIVLASLSLQDVQNYLEKRWNPSLPVWPWMEAMHRKNLSHAALATLVYDEIQIVEAKGGAILDFYHPQYPIYLRYINDPPNALTAIGSLGLLETFSVGIVGSRKASAFALYETRELARALALRGHVIVSGGAIGCDIAGHLGALGSGIDPCPTIVVFAGGLSQLHPRCHQVFFEQMQAKGALFLSERLWDYPARPFDFPARNRIISGLSQRLIVMQAGEKSGARLTASSALDQGREVYVMVHPEEDVRALGSHQLIDDGAMPFLSAQDYLGLPVCF